MATFTSVKHFSTPPSETPYWLEEQPMTLHTTYLLIHSHLVV